jgi:hypothetical protein
MRRAGIAALIWINELDRVPWPQEPSNRPWGAAR